MLSSMQNVFSDSSKILPLPWLVTLTTHAIHIENNYWSYYHHTASITAHTMIVLPFTCGCKNVPAECESTLHTCDIGMANTLQHGVNQHCLTKAHLRWSSSCFSHRHSLLVKCMSQNGVNRYCISMALSGHWRPIIEAGCTRRHCIPVTLIWQTHCSMVWTNTA